MYIGPLYKGYVRHCGTAHVGVHEAIVTEMVWSQANRAIAGSPSRSRGSRSNAADPQVHLLRGLITCRDCGSTMTPQPSGKCNRAGQPYLYYVCTSVIKDTRDHPCRVRRLPARRFEQLIVQALSDLGDDPRLLAATAEAAFQESQPLLQKALDEGNAIRAGLETVEKELTRLLAVFKSVDHVPETVRDECIRLDRERGGLYASLAAVEAKIEGLRQEWGDLGEVRGVLQELRGAIQGQPLADQKNLLRSLIAGVDVNLGEPQNDETPPPGGARKSLLRTRRLVVNIRLARKGHFIASVNQTPGSSFVNRYGSPYRTTFATFSVAPSASNWLGASLE